MVIPKSSAKNNHGFLLGIKFNSLKFNELFSQKKTYGSLTIRLPFSLN